MIRVRFTVLDEKLHRLKEISVEDNANLPVTNDIVYMPDPKDEKPGLSRFRVVERHWTYWEKDRPLKTLLDIYMNRSKVLAV